MSECDVMRESMPLLLTESLDPARRELTHQHIESCLVCGDEWAAYQETWSILDELPIVDPPARLKERFLADVFPPAVKPNVVPFRQRPAFKWIAQAAAVAVIAGGSYFAGHRGATPSFTPSNNAPGSVLPTNGEITPVSYSIAESRVLPAQAINPNIEGKPDIQNVQFVDDNPNDAEIGITFDLTSHVKVTGKPTDKAMVHLLRYVLENEDHLSPSGQRAIDWVKATYSQPKNADPEMADAIAHVLRNDTHEGVRLKAADTLKNSPMLSNDTDTHHALIEALKNDPNPAVRMKAVEALANLARNGTVLGNDALTILQQKASQGDENPYVRVKAAEALKLVHP